MSLIMKTILSKNPTFLDQLFDSFVPEDNKFRKLRDNLDVSFVKELCTPFYKNGNTGRPAESPERLFLMLFLMIYEGIPGETRLVERVRTDVAYRFFCGFHIGEKIPDHSTLWVFRKRVGVELFRQVMARILEQCIETGLVNGDRLMFDCTNTNAKGTPYSKYQQALILAKALEEHCREITLEANGGGNLLDAADFRKRLSKIASEATEYKNPSLIERKIREENDSNPSLPNAHRKPEPSKTPENRAAECGSSSGEIKSDAPGEPETPKNPENTSNPDSGNDPGSETVVSFPDDKALKDTAKRIKAVLPHTAGDSDARCGHTSTHKNFTGYMNGILTDSKHQVVVSAALYPGNVCQKDTVVDAMRFYCRNVVPMLERLGKVLKNPEIVMDSAFDYTEVYETATECGLNAITSLRKRPSKKDIYDTDCFKMDETGQLTCPNGKPMLRSKKADDEDRYKYYGGAMCKNCPLRANCTKSKKGRTVELNPEAKLQRQEQLIKAGDDRYKEALKKRMVIEGIFGTGKAYHHLGKALYRSAGMVNIQILMWVTVHNIGKLHRYGHRVTSPPAEPLEQEQLTLLFYPEFKGAAALGDLAAAA